MRNVYKMLVGKPERNRPIGRPRHIWKVIRMALTKIGWEGMDWIRPVQDRNQCRAFVSTAMNLLVHKRLENFVTSFVTVSFLRSILLRGV
jgi:hypothetical protein